MKSHFKIFSTAAIALLLIAGLTYSGCKKTELEKQIQGEDKIALTEFLEDGKHDGTFKVNPEPNDCGPLLALLPEQTTEQIFENLDILAQGLTELSNNREFVGLVEEKCAEQFDEDFNVLFRDLKVKCSTEGFPMESRMERTADRLCFQNVRDNLARALQVRYHWDGDIIYSQIFIPFFEQVKGMKKVPVIAPLRSEADYELGAELTGYHLVFDNGNTDSVIAIVNSTLPAGQKKNALLNASPLSDEVLIPTLNSTMPPGHIRQVFEANAPYSQQIVDEVNASSLPNGIKNNVLNAPPVVKFSTVTTEELARKRPVWVISVNDNVNCAGFISGEILPGDATAGTCSDIFEKRWFEFYPKIKFECKNENWLGGKGNVKFTWVRYDPGNKCPWCEMERKEKLMNISNNDLCDEIDIHLEFCNSTWYSVNEIALLVYERDALAKKKFWDYINGDLEGPNDDECRLKYRTKEKVYFVQHSTGGGGFNWGTYPTPGQWGGTTTTHTTTCEPGFSDDCNNNNSTSDQQGFIQLRGGREGA